MPINWKTALAGLLAGLVLIAPQIERCLKGEECSIAQIIAGLAIAIMGGVSKDKDVTGVGDNARRLEK